MSDENEKEIDHLASFRGDDPYFSQFDPADLAIRTCQCGRRIDGFDDYLQHLTEQFQEGDPDAARDH